MSEPAFYGICVICGAAKELRKTNHWETPTHARRRRTCSSPACLGELIRRNNKRRWDASGRRLVQDRVCVVCGKLLIRRKGEASQCYRERKTCSSGVQGKVTACYRELCRRQGKAGRGRMNMSLGLIRHPQFRRWECPQYFVCLDAHAEKNSPRWDCPKGECPREDVDVETVSIGD